MKIVNGDIYKIRNPFCWEVVLIFVTIFNKKPLWMIASVNKRVSSGNAIMLFHTAKKDYLYTSKEVKEFLKGAKKIKNASINITNSL